MTESLLDQTEEVNICVVDGEVKADESENFKINVTARIIVSRRQSYLTNVENHII
jgi:hypothetical protein